MSTGLGLPGALRRTRPGDAPELEHCSVLRDRTAEDLRRRPRRSLKTARKTKTGKNQRPRFGVGAHRQDAKGTRWMPWHQETKKDVDGCDKPR